MKDLTSIPKRIYRSICSGAVIRIRIWQRCACYILLYFFAATSVSAQYQAVNIAQQKQKIKEAKYDSTKTRLETELGWALRISDQAEAERLADDVISIATKSNDYVRLAEAYRIKGFVRVVQQKLDECLEMYAIGTDYAKKANNKFYQASFLNLTAGMYQDKGDFDKAIQYYLEGSKLADESGVPEIMAQLANNLAEAYSDEGRPISFTLPFYQKAMKYEEAMGNWQYLGMIYSNIAKEYMQAGNKTEAEKAVKLSISNLTKQSDRGYVYATVSGDIGEMYLNMHNYAEAEKFLLTGYTILDTMHYKDNVLTPLSALTRLYVEKNELDKAEKYVATLLKRSTEYRAKLYLRDSYKALSDIAKKRNRPAQALAFYEKYKTINDSVFNENKEKTIANVESRMLLNKKELEVQYESNRKSEENKLLKKSNSDLQNKTIIAIAVASVLLITGILLIGAYRSSRRRQAELENQKRIIENQSMEKDTLLTEINHRVKNNLQIISSLLNLQANSLSDEKAIEALRDSHKRVKAISLIHQKLYGFDELTAIPLEEYITALYADLSLVYNTAHIKLVCRTRPEDLKLDMESAVPVGLILNEIITNALKYAFAGKESGTILIEFTESADHSYTLTVYDDGVGLPTGFDPDKSASLGFRIIRELTRQLRGKFQYHTNDGTLFTIGFPNTSARKKMN